MDHAFTPAVVKGGFRQTGMFPLDIGAIDPSKMIGDSITYTTTDDEPIPLMMECVDDPIGIFKR